MEAEELATKSVGNILREGRLAKGLSIEDVESATNIRGLFLTYLENEEFEKTPGEFFVKGAIRTYGNFLGLNGAELVELYKSSNGGKALHATEAQGIREAKTVTMKLQLKDKRDIGSGTGKLELPKLSKVELPWLQIGMGVAALAVIGALYFAVPAIINWSKTTKQPPAVPAPIATSQKAPEAPKPVPVVEKLVLELKASGLCWLEVRADDKKVAELMLREGDIKTYEAKEKLTVKYGNIGVVNITLNGKNLNTPGEHGVANMVYTKETLERQQKSNNQSNVTESPASIAPQQTVEAPVVPAVQNETPKPEVATQVEKTELPPATAVSPKVEENSMQSSKAEVKAPATTETPKVEKPSKKNKKTK